MKLDETQEPELNQASPAATQSNRGLHMLSLFVVVALFAGLGMLVWSGIHARAAAEEQLVRTTNEAAVPEVAVTHPELSAPLEEIVLPGNVQAFTDSPIYARTSGYLKQWNFDIGARVKKGDLLAEIETPELDQQLQQARAALETAQANYHLADTTAARWQFLLKSNSVSKQETDQAVANMAAQKATVDANAANVRRLEQLQSFEKVYAPFDGVITMRNTDIGALIDAGATTPNRELFHLAAIGTLRVFVAVPELYSNAARAGANATLTLSEYPDRVFSGTFVRDASAIDAASRTLLVEVDVNNSGGLILPGAYVSVHLKLPGKTRSVVIPANTLLFRREGLNVGVVRDGRVALTSITIGRDYGSTVEVVSGLNPKDQIILDPSDSLISGTPVHVTQSAAAAPAGGKAQ